MSKTILKVKIEDAGQDRKTIGFNYDLKTLTPNLFILILASALKEISLNTGLSEQRVLKELEQSLSDTTMSMED